MEFDLTKLTEQQLAELVFGDFQAWAEEFATFKGITGKPEPSLKPNVLQLRVIAHYRKCQLAGKPCLIMILKPRQKGASTIAEAIAYFHMRRHKDLNGVLMGDVQSTSDKVFEMFRRYAEGDKYPYKDDEQREGNIKAGLNLADEITLRSGSKWWKETAGSTNAGRSGTVQVLHMDEVAYFPLSASKDPTTAVLGSFYKEAPYSLGFATSTANGANGWFHDTWWGENDWHKVFAAWFEFPDASTPFESDAQRRAFENSMKEDEKVEQKLYGVTLEQLHWRRKKIATDYKGDANKFKQEYPSSAEGAFLSSSRMRFDELAVASLLAWAKQNDQRQNGNLVMQGRRGVATWVPDPRGSISRWEEPRDGCRYLVSVDTCTGKDQQIGGTTSDPDYHSVQVWRAGYTAKNGDYLHPACVALHHSREDTDILAEIAASMSAYYGHCLIVPEVNNSGLHIVKCLVNMGCNVFRREAHTQRRKIQTEEEKMEAYGWMTDNLTRKWIVDNAAPVIRQEAVMIYAPEIVEELKAFIISDAGVPKAAPAKHDDHVLALCIAIYNLGAATEYRIGRIQGVDARRLATDPYYMAPDGFRRKTPMGRG